VIRYIEFKELKGKVLVSLENQDNEELIFTTTDGEIYRLFHSQDCCEDVYIEDVCGDLDDIIGSTILVAEEVIHGTCETPDGVDGPEYEDESFTWTFYKIDTRKGGVTIRWYGSSNGYYSETVDFCKV